MRDAARRLVTVYREEGTGLVLRRRFCTPNRAVHAIFRLSARREALDGARDGSGGPQRAVLNVSAGMADQG